MKGYISLEIPTKRYLKAYIISELGDKPIMSNDHRFGSKLYDLMAHKTNERRTEFANVRYNAKLKIYVNYHTFFTRGGHLNETNIKNFNLFIENDIKARYRMYMDFYMQLIPSFERNLPEVRKHIGVDADDWENDSIKKDYYRYRVRTNKPLIYKSNSDRIVLNRHVSDAAF